MTAQNPKIILVRPQMGENIGATARAMLNFNLTNLNLIKPRDGWPNQNAIDNASGALDLIPPPKLHDSLPSALKDCQYVYATTARQRDMEKPVFDLENAMVDAKKRSQDGQNIAFVFGPERTGLENDEIVHCHALIHINTNPKFSSLNLGQAVLLICSAWQRPLNIESVSHEPKAMTDQPATLEAFEDLFHRLQKELEHGGFFKEDNLKPTMIRNIRTMLLRSEMSDQELRTFHGIISALIGKKNNNNSI